MFAYYSERLNGVELNGSFYRTPAEAALAKWRREAPEGFRFCFKAHRGLTYSAEAFDKVGLAAIVGARLGELGPALGPVLLQWPPARKRDTGLLDAVLEALALPAAAEFRDEGWFDESTYAVLRRRRAALVVTDEEKWPRAPAVETAGFAYYRLRRDYSGPELEPWVERLRSEARGRDVHAYFKHEPEAPARALALLGRGEAKPVTNTMDTLDAGA